MKKMRNLKGIVALSLSAAMVLGTAITSNATTLKEVFNAKYYSDSYQDIKDVFGDNADLLYNHYITYGLGEGRDMNGFLNLSVYRDTYKDLEDVFGDDWDAYLNHYLTYGIKEGRVTGTDFNASAYAERYPDLFDAYGYDPVALYEHYLAKGKAEGRDAAVEVKQTATSSNSSSNNNSNTDVSDGDANTDTNTDTDTEDNGDEVIDLSLWYDTEFLYFDYNTGFGTIYTFPGVHFIGASDVLNVIRSSDSKSWLYLNSSTGRTEWREYSEPDDPTYLWFTYSEGAYNGNDPQNTYVNTDPSKYLDGMKLHLKVYSEADELLCSYIVTYGVGIEKVPNDYVLSQEDIDESTRIRDEYLALW